MRNFPPPHQSELLYSTIARASIYGGITSPKILLDEVFGNRNVIATLDLPSHINHISHLLRGTGRHSAEQLIFNHTLFPLYAPFIQPELKNKAIDLLKGKTRGAAHMMLGIAASRIKAIRNFQSCPKCIEHQLQNYGEAFWRREWFIPNLSLCIEHGPLSIYKEKPSDSRHHFQPLFLSKFPVSTFEQFVHQDTLILSRAQQLLNLSNIPDISFDQWTSFYYGLAYDFGHTKGYHIKHEQIFDSIFQTFGEDYLLSKGLFCNLHDEHSWIKSTFRQHRKSFSFFEHLLIWQTFLPNEKLEHIFQETQHIRPILLKKPQSTENIDLAKLTEYRKLWQQLVRQNGIQSSRSKNNGGLIYAWLYRNDYHWLLQFNSKNKMKKPVPEFKVKWQNRDRGYVKTLLNIAHLVKDDLNAPRCSANWYLMQLPQHSTIEHNLSKLPLVRKFLTRYVESITEYQLRRVCTAVELLHKNSQKIQLWHVYRLAGISKERITPEAAKILKLSGHFEINDS